MELRIGVAGFDVECRSRRTVGSQRVDREVRVRGREPVLLAQDPREAFDVEVEREQVGRVLLRNQRLLEPHQHTVRIAQATQAEAAATRPDPQVRARIGGRTDPVEAQHTRPDAHAASVKLGGQPVRDLRLAPQVDRRHHRPVAVAPLDQATCRQPGKCLPDRHSRDAELRRELGFARQERAGWIRVGRRCACPAPRRCCGTAAGGGRRQRR